jgi:hypothetical protein
VKESLPSGVTAVSSLSCPVTAVCLAVGTLSSGGQVLLGAGSVGGALTGQLAPAPTS